ncbi:MAG: type II toxin-antitoxin system RelE/ParE family toxin [Pseudomonadota bacterium]|nr:type II toxin-antitoxin system RelE/ParE family toxin [Pseudomonadota bacterium]
MRVRLTDEAKAKLRAIRTHIAEDAPQRADAMIDRITRHASRIGEMPRAGRKVPEYQLDTLREVLERPYRIIYRIQPDAIEVLTVMHYRQLLPDDLV